MLPRLLNLHIGGRRSQPRQQQAPALGIWDAHDEPSEQGDLTSATAAVPSPAPARRDNGRSSASCARRRKRDHPSFAFRGGPYDVYLPDVLMEMVFELVRGGPTEAFVYLNGTAAEGPPPKAVVVRGWSVEQCVQRAFCNPAMFNLATETGRNFVTMHTHPAAACLERHRGQGLEVTRRTCATATFYKPSSVDLETVWKLRLKCHIVATPFHWYVILCNATPTTVLRNGQALADFLHGPYESLPPDEAIAEVNRLCEDGMHILTIPVRDLQKTGTCLAKSSGDVPCASTSRRDCEESGTCLWNPEPSQSEHVRFVEGYTRLLLC